MSDTTTREARLRVVPDDELLAMFQLRAPVALSDPQIRRLIGERFSAQRSTNHLIETIERVCAKLEAALARAEAAEALLKPFAKVAESDIGSDETDADLFRPMSSRYNRAPLLKVGHLRRAAAHLDTVSQQANPTPEISLSGAEQGRDSLLEDNKRLMEALGPFVPTDGTMERELFEGVSDGAPVNLTVRCGDLRRARAEFYGAVLPTDRQPEAAPQTSEKDMSEEEDEPSTTELLDTVLRCRCGNNKVAVSNYLRSDGAEVFRIKCPKCERATQEGFSPKALIDEWNAKLQAAPSEGGKP